MKKLDYQYTYAIPAYFAVSKYCNIRCSYCYLPEDFKNKREDIDSEAIASVHKLVDKAANEGFAFDRMYLHGAEPTTLKPETIVELVNQLSTVTLRQHINIQTNGVALNKQYLDRLGDMKDKIAIGYSVDLPPAAHNKNRQKTYRKIIENIKEARDRGYQHRLLCCINKETMKDLPAVKKEIDFYHKEFPSMTIAFKIITGELQLNEEEKIEWANFLSDNGIYEYDHSIWSPEMICQAHGNNCWWFEFAHDGGVTACNKSYNEKGKFANWFNEPMVKIMQKRRTLYQNYQVPAQCFGCEYWLICKGGCPVDRQTIHFDRKDDSGIRVVGKEVVTLDCSIKKQIYARMKASGLHPLVHYKNLPAFKRQKAYNAWKKNGEKYGFLEK